jgi:hypothetical protein
MKFKKIFTMVGMSLTMLAAITGAALAQFGRGPSFPTVNGDWNPVVGSGAVYKFEAKGEKSGTWEIALVGEEKVNGQPGYWMEMTMHMENGSGIVKNLIVKNQDEVTVQRMVMKQGDQPAMEFPMTMMNQFKGKKPADKVDIRNRGKKIGTETITTPAGTFSCDHYQVTNNGETADVWVSPKVSPYGLVKVQSPKMTMTLEKVITGAKTKITETPKKFEIPGLPK